MVGGTRERGPEKKIKKKKGRKGSPRPPMVVVTISDAVVAP